MVQSLLGKDLNVLKLLKNILLIPVCILLTGICFAQNNNQLEKAESYLKSTEIDSAAWALKSVDLKKLSTFNKAKYHELNGFVLIRKDKQDDAFTDLMKAKQLYKSIDSLSQIAHINLSIIEILSSQDAISSQEFIDEYISYSEKSNDPKDKSHAYATLAITYLNTDNAPKALYYFDEAISSALKANDTILATDYLFNKGVVYNTVAKKYDSALSIFKKVVPIYKKNNDIDYISYSYNNQAEAYKKLGDYKTAIAYYKKADSIPLKKNNLQSKIIFYENIADVYEKTGDYKNAYLFNQKLNTFKDSINEVEQTIAISEIQTKYQTAEKEKQLLIQTEQKRQNRNIAFSLAAALLFVTIIGYLVYKNTKKKQHIAEQQREIEIRKTEKLLKDQELTIIDAMIEGQEKERQRLASDLHDSVGATLSAAKLQFSHLHQNKDKIKNTEELYLSTESLLNQAYQEVRSMAHIKNSGVIAKMGLLTAVKNLVKNVNGTNNLTLELEEFGLDGRLENSLEITVFRIIQELVTNIIKHAQATEASILITQHQETLNIIVEDNGRGFDAKKTLQKNGMGLSGIERRVEHNEGTMEIDSTIGKGTTIVIDIPL